MNTYAVEAQDFPHTLSFSGDDSDGPRSLMSNKSQSTASNISVSSSDLTQGAVMIGILARANEGYEFPSMWLLVTKRMKMKYHEFLAEACDLSIASRIPQSERIIINGSGGSY